MSKFNKILRGIKLGLPAITSFTSGLSPQDAMNDALVRYTGFDMDKKELQTENVKKAVGFYAGNVIEHKVLSILKIPQMAGKKKILSVVGQYLPEIQAAGDFAAGLAPKTVQDRYGQRSIGYFSSGHLTWLDNPATRDEFVKTLTGRVALGLFSRFAGPMVNKHLPKGVNL